MVYYDSKGELVEFGHSKISIEGANGVVHKTESGIAYKEYFWNSDTIITKSMFEFLRQIDHPNFIKLIERYYQIAKVKDYESFLDAINISSANNSINYSEPYKIDMYTYHWVEEEFVDILEEDKDYLLENLNGLLNFADFLSANNIALADMKIENSVCNKNHIVLIDPDMYYFVPVDKRKNLYRRNRSLILYLVISLCQKEARVTGSENFFKVSELFQDSLQTPDQAIQILSKKVHGYKNLVDYFHR